MAKLTGITEIEVLAEQSANLDTVCYRGSAPLAHLAAISQADIFDQETNPDGLQRDLSPKHAAEAYAYTYREPDKEFPRAFPEIVLNVRDKRVVEVEEIEGSGDLRTFRVRFNTTDMRDGRVAVSRVDGNHRLFFAEGDEHRDPILASAPFQLHIGLSREQERSLFVDINANQKGLNSSHLAVLRSKLTAEEQEIRDHLPRWIAKRLAEGDPQSPWHGLIHLGGSKKGTRAQGLTRYVNFASLESGVDRTLKKSQYIHDLTDPEAQYALVRNYWQAVKEVFSEEWARPKDYLLLKNIGVISMSILGGTIIDRCIPRGQVDIEDMKVYLQQARSRFDWGKNAAGDRAVTGMSGNRAALIIAGEMTQELEDPDQSNVIRDLQAKLAASAATPSGL
jgi:DGQHR domain-containing protein